MFFLIKHKQKNKKQIVKEIRNMHLKEIQSRYSKEVFVGVEKIIKDYSEGKTDSKYVLPQHIMNHNKEIIVHKIREVLQKEYDFPYPRDIGINYIYYNFGNQGMCDVIRNKR